MACLFPHGGGPATIARLIVVARINNLAGGERGVRNQQTVAVISRGFWILSAFPRHFEPRLRCRCSVNFMFQYRNEKITQQHGFPTSAPALILQPGCLFEQRARRFKSRYLSEYLGKFDAGFAGIHPLMQHSSPSIALTSHDLDDLQRLSLS
jgi:hypothetical protein